MAKTLEEATSTAQGLSCLVTGGASLSVMCGEGVVGCDVSVERSWSGDVTGLDSPVSVVMDGDKTVEAGFGEVAVFPDATLERVIRAAMGRPTGVIFVEDVRGSLASRENRSEDVRDGHWFDDWRMVK